MSHRLRLSASRLRPRLPPPPSRTLGLQYEPLHSHSPPGQKRHFSAGDVAGAFLRSSEFLITNIHTATHTPWFISIPLVALVIGATVRAPLTLYAHNLAHRRARLTPLVQAQSAIVGMGLRRKAVPDLRERVRVATKRRTKELFSGFGIGATRSVLGGLASLPVFVSNLEVIRRMCGGPKGMIGSLVLAASGAGTKTEATTQAAEGVAASSTSAAEMSPSENLGELTISGTSSDTGSSLQEILASITQEPTLATEGCLWFPSLLEADPYHILPSLLSVVMVLNLLPESTAGKRELFGLQAVVGDKHAAIQGSSPARRAFQRSMLLVAIAIGPITMDMPAALHLYWLASSGFGLAVSKGIKWWKPLPKTSVRPCRGMEVPLLRPKPS